MSFPIAQSLTTHASTQPGVGAANIIDRMHPWQQCSVIISEYMLTTIYGFNLRFHRHASITTRMLWLETECKVACRACANHQISTLVKRHTLVPSPTPPLHSVAWEKGGRENSINATVPTSLPGDHSSSESWHVVCDVMPYVYCAENSADLNEAGYPNVEIEHDKGKCTLFYCCFCNHGMLTYNISACEVCIIWRKPTEPFKSYFQSPSRELVSQQWSH